MDVYSINKSPLLAMPEIFPNLSAMLMNKHHSSKRPASMAWRTLPFGRVSGVGLSMQ